MAFKVDKDAVSGLRALLKYSVIRYSVAIVIVIVGFGGCLYVIKDSKMVEAFKRDDKKLDAILTELQGVRDDVRILERRMDRLESKVDASIEMSVVGVVFNPNVPNVYRRQAFDTARQHKMNHGIKDEYRRFVQANAESLWDSPDIASDTKRIYNQQINQQSNQELP